MKTLKIKLAALKFNRDRQIDKIHEEFLELSSALDRNERLEEAFDLMQAVASYINSFPKKSVKFFNKKHLAKIQAYLKSGRIAEDKEENRGHSCPTVRQIADKILTRYRNMVLVEGGTFQMGGRDDNWGDNKPVHDVMVGSFYMCKYPVTQAEYKAIMGKNPSRYKENSAPVDGINWYEAVEYCNKRSEREGLTPCYTIDGTNVTCDWKANGYRLPTEAEWEYAARGGKHNSPYRHSGGDDIYEVAWHIFNGGSRIHKVGQKKANALGIHDMNGNVWEWCWDWYDENYYEDLTLIEPLGPASGDSRVCRGGSWYNNDDICQCAYRGSNYPTYWSAGVGFRVVRSVFDEEDRK